MPHLLGPTYHASLTRPHLLCLSYYAGRLRLPCLTYPASATMPHFPSLTMPHLLCLSYDAARPRLLCPTYHAASVRVASAHVPCRCVSRVGRASTLAPAHYGARIP
eukprot:scaffold57314_cov34-Phaeocystis_antarctica.AAC.3